VSYSNSTSNRAIGQPRRSVWIPDDHRGCVAIPSRSGTNAQISPLRPQLLRRISFPKHRVQIADLTIHFPAYRHPSPFAGRLNHSRVGAGQETLVMRSKLAERQQAMKKKLLAARETFRNCAFRDTCSEESETLDPEACSRCSPARLQELVRHSRSSSSSS
jgi:hypothetical protein